MFEVTLDQVRELCGGSEIFREAMECYNTNHMDEFEIEDGGNYREVSAVIRGTYEDNYPYVQLDSNGIDDYQCDCDTYYLEGVACKHITALLIKYYSHIHRNVKGFKSSEASYIENYFRGKMGNDNFIFNKEALSVAYCYELQKKRFGTFNTLINIKVGKDRLYVVKDINAFLNAVETGEGCIEFGKNFTYNPQLQFFKDEDKEIIDLFLDIKASNDYITELNRYGFHSELINSKNIFLTPRQALTFFQKIKNRNIDLKVDKEIFKDVPIIQEDMPLKFNLTARNKYMYLTHPELKMPQALIGGESPVYFYEEKIYNISDTQKEHYYPFYVTMNRSKQNIIILTENDNDTIASYIMPALQKLSGEVKVDKKITEKFHKEELNPEVYLDRNDDTVIANLKMFYGEISLNPLKPATELMEGKVLVRDIERENGIISYLEAYGFTKKRDSMILEDEEGIINFLYEGMDKLQDLSNVFYSDSFKSTKLYRSSSYKASVSLNSENLLEFTFSIGDVDREELKDIFEAVKLKKKYFKLKNGSFVDLKSGELNEVANLIEYLNIKDSELLKDKIVLPRYNAMYLENRLKQTTEMQISRDKKFKQLISSVAEVKDNDYEIPSHLMGVMRNYQITGFKWFKTLKDNGFGGILADDMGLGKTLQAIAFIESEMQEKNGEHKPCLVVAPSSLVYNWQSEIEKFSSGLKVVVIQGAKNEREEKISEILENDVVITSYPLIRRDIDNYIKIPFKYCFLDEAQYIKNPDSVNANAVKEIKAEGYFALTGTPIENSLVELWSIFDFVMPGYLFSRRRFASKFETPIYKDKSEEAYGALYQRIKPFILRRKKSEVIKELPPKIEHKLMVEMEEEQKKLYAAYAQKAKQEINTAIGSSGFERSRIKILAILTRLRQICCDPSSFIENYEGENAKFSALDDILQDAIGAGHRVLIFSQFTSVLSRLRERIISNGMSTMYLDGSTKVESRLDMVKSFNSGNTDVFLISLKAGGTGLNLTGADTVIHFDPWWNPAVEDQATDRAHRIGQKKTVEVIKMITKGTIEEKISKLQETKKEMVNNIIKDGETMFQNLSAEDIAGLL